MITAAWAGILAAGDPKLQFFWPGLILAGVLLVGAFIVMLVDRWRKRAAKEDQSLSASDQLASYRSMYERGELSEEEYEAIRAHLGGELRRKAREKPVECNLLDAPALPARADEKPSPNGHAPEPPAGAGPSTDIRPG